MELLGKKMNGQEKANSLWYQVKYYFTFLILDLLGKANKNMAIKSKQEYIYVVLEDYQVPTSLFCLGFEEKIESQIWLSKYDTLHHRYLVKDLWREFSLLADNCWFTHEMNIFFRYKRIIIKKPTSTKKKTVLLTI